MSWAPKNKELKVADNGLGKCQQKLMVLVALPGISFALWPLIKDCQHYRRQMVSVHCGVVGEKNKVYFSLWFLV